LPRNRLTGDDGDGHDSGDGVAGLVEQRLGAALGAEAELMRRSWRIGLWRGSEAAAAQRAAGRSCTGVRARVRMAAAWRGRVRERARVCLKGRGRPRRAGPGLTRRGDHGGDPAGSLREVDGGRG